MTTYPYPFHGYRQPRGQKRVPLSRLHEGRFGRLFRKLEPAPDYDDAELAELAGQMREIEPAQGPGGWGGPEAPAEDFDNPTVPAGYTYFGQFVDHDITFDPVSQLGRKNDPDALHDFRSPRFDLDSLYGSGPIDEPFQYEKEGPEVPEDQRAPASRLLIGENGHGDLDLPRNDQGVALIGDPRNDENIIVSQLQLVFLRAHNKLVEAMDRNDGRTPDERFAETQRQLRWHYQWIVVNDYLPRIAGRERVETMLRLPDGGEPEFNLRFYEPKNNPYMPVEFSAAAFRFGHSQIRSAYHLNNVVRDRPIFLPGPVGEFDDLRGFRPLPQEWTVDWKLFLELDGSVPQPSRRIDAKLVPALFSLPGLDPSALPLRNLLRGQALGLPSGQDVARLLGETPRTGAELGTVLEPTPLWFYILSEAELGGGEDLGPVGATIVAEILLGLLQLDPNSWINQEPAWQPTLPKAGERFELRDLVAFATA